MIFRGLESGEPLSRPINFPKGKGTMAKQGQNSGFSKIRLFLLVSVILLIFAGLFGRILYIQLVHGEEYTRAVKEQQGTMQDSTITALRGTIYDRNHNVLAETRQVYDVIIDPKALQSADPVDQTSTIQQLANVLKISDTSVLEKYLGTEYADSQYERFSAGMQISESVKSVLEEKIDEGVIVGVWFEAIQSRNYPNDELAAHVIGFNGVYGLEMEYDEELSGVDGRSMRTLAEDGQYLEEVVEAQDGNALVLTLDQTVQYYLEQALAKVMEEEECLRACGVLMNPKTGEVYAMANYPTFNLNDVEEILGLSAKYTEEMKKSDTFLSGIWSNFAVSGTYEPGSTYKPIFAAAALDSGSINEYESFTCNSYYMYYDQAFQCAFNVAHGVQSIREIIQNSCNVGMIQASERTPAKTYYQYQQAFGIGQKTGIDLPYEESAESLVYDLDTLGPVEMATVSFGQGFNLTPIQLLTAESAVVNDGYMVKPHVVKQILDADGNVISETNTQTIRQVISAETSAVIRGGMEAVVETGTGTGVNLEGYRIGGKTGTAEKGDYSEGKYIVSFTGFAPIDDPEVGILIILDEAKSGVSSPAQSVAAEVLSQVLPYLNIYPQS